MADFHNSTSHIARHARTCYETGATIAVGERYTRFSGVFEGDFYCIRMKAGIAALFDRCNAESWKNNREGVVFGGLSDYIFDSLRQKSTPQSISDAKEFLRIHGPSVWMSKRISEAEAALVS